MRYTVIWDSDATDTLATLWISSTDRGAVTDAVAEVDRLLGQSPEL